MIAGGLRSTPIPPAQRIAEPICRSMSNGVSQLVYAWYGDAEIQSTGFGGEYDTFDLIFLSVSADWRLGRR
jgi:hypothetical protein